MDLEQINFFFLISLLPNEILGQILGISGLSVIDRLHCEQVCRHWRWAVGKFGWTEQRKLDWECLFRGRRDWLALSGRFDNESLIALFRRCRHRLVELDLNLCSFPYLTVDGVCSELHLLPNLAKLNLGVYSINVGDIRLFPEALRELKLDANRLEVRHLTAIQQRCPRLDSLMIAGNDTSTISMTVMNAFIGGYPGLKELGFRENFGGFSERSPDDHLTSIGQLKALEELELLRYFDSFDDAALRAVVTGCRRLRRLAFNRYVGVSEQGLLQLAKMPSLTELEVRGDHPHFRDSVLKAIAQRGQLKKLTISGSERVTEEAVIFLIGRCKSLVSLNIRWCRLISMRVWLEALMMSVENVRWEK